MTYRLDVARGRDIVARWCALAEQRLQYLTELFDTGRWRRFHSEIAFLENIQEAKAAVEIWQELLRRETTPGIAAVDISWPNRSGATLLRGEALHDEIAKPQPRVAKEPARAEASIAPREDLAGLEEADFAPNANAPVRDSVMELRLDIASIEQRYPLLRNAL